MCSHQPGLLPSFIFNWFHTLIYLPRNQKEKKKKKKKRKWNKWMWPQTHAQSCWVHSQRVQNPGSSGNKTPKPTHYPNAQLTTARSQPKVAFSALAQGKQTARLWPNIHEDCQGGSGNAPGPCSHLSHWGIGFLWSKGKKPQSAGVWGRGHSSPWTARAGSSAIAAHIALHVHPFKLAKAGVRGLFPDAAKVNGAADPSGAAIETPHSRALC